MKPFISLMTLTALLMGLVSCSTLQGQEKQEEALRIIIEKNIQGELRKIDTILRFHRDSIKSVWYHMDAQKRDSIQREIHKKMEYVQQEHLEKIHEKMEEVHARMEKVHDSLERQRFEVIIPRMQQLDSLQRHDWEKQLKKLDSLDSHVMIRLDSLGVHPGQIQMDIDINLDSILEHTRKSLEHLDSLELPDHIDVPNLTAQIERGMAHLHRFYGDRALEDDQDRDGMHLEYMNGKVMRIKTDARGQVEKVIIMSPDGETLEVKEGREAREFVTRDGEKVTIKEAKE